MIEDIRKKIAGERALRVQAQGAAQGLTLPAQREFPLVPFNVEPLIICEIKRHSPSKGTIKADMDPLEQAAIYRNAGVRQVSVLTEESYFKGSLADLMAVKKQFPGLSLLRKDFLLTLEDIEVSYRAGADAFLLIAGLLQQPLLQRMYERGIQLGMTPLVELHDEEDIALARQFKPSLVGINSRNLRDFTIDPLRPLKIRTMIDWPCQVIYESGIHTKEQACFASGTGFSGVLVGEGAVRDPGLIPALHRAFAEKKSGSEKRYQPLRRLYDRYRFNRPLVKVCGITQKNDAELAMENGADMLGFILAESPRRVTPDFIRYVAHKPILKCGVVVLKQGESLPREVETLLEEGALDMIQFHGEEDPELTGRYPGYKAFRIRNAEDLEARKAFPQPVSLIDTFSAEAHGGTGKRVSGELVSMASQSGPLWLAGGITPDNIGEIWQNWQPDLVDLSSGLEASPGIKDPRKMEQFFKELSKNEKL